MNREDISFPGAQSDLIDSVAEAAKGPVIVVFIGGGAVDFSSVLSNVNVSALLWAGYPGQSGGQAIAETIFGDSPPAGRLPYTVYPSSYVDAVSMFDMGMRPNGSTNPGRTYRFYTGTPVLEFGHGLSYSSFKYEWATAPTAVERQIVDFYSARASPSQRTSRLEQGEALISSLDSPIVTSFRVNVTNTGNVESDDVVLAFATPPSPGQGGQPLKSLIGFQRVHLAPGETQSVFFGVRASALCLPDQDGALTSVTGKWKIQVGQPSLIEAEIDVV